MARLEKYIRNRYARSFIHCETPVSDMRFLKRNDIDAVKWNNCIASAANSLPYAFSWYLDAVAENWDALVEGDYKTVMPLVWMRKLGIKCLYQPYYCQQLGIFGRDPSKETNRELINYIKANYKYININLNPSSVLVSGEYQFRQKKN